MNDPDKPTYSTFDLEPPRKRGCVFYGCLTVAVLGLISAGLIAFVAYRANQFLNQMLEEYSDTKPMEFPPIAMPAEEKTALFERFDAFKKALDENKGSGPLVLSADDVNALLDRNEDLRGKIHVTLPGDTVHGQLSFPLEGLGWQRFQGRFLNGEGTFKVALVNGILVVTLQDLSVRGKPLTGQILEGFRQQNLAKDQANNPNSAKFIAKFKSIEVKDGKLIVTPKSPEQMKAADSPETAPPADAEKKDEPAVEKKDQPAVEKKDEPKADAPPPTPGEPEPKAKDEPKPAEPKPEAPQSSGEPKAEAPKQAA